MKQTLAILLLATISLSLEGERKQVYLKSTDLFGVERIKLNDYLWYNTHTEYFTGTKNFMKLSRIKKDSVITQSKSDLYTYLNSRDAITMPIRYNAKYR